ncbi:MAG: hypothetical protein KME16_16230 [Scytolyngbya sp. HA4215-MV1]|jgi:dissimilatory sulfite reductase (desulfoviridin) alpha/beta subunit|nr:hypothetical protein [Scytolyngbya sp. HA4215-MV1]
MHTASIYSRSSTSIKQVIRRIFESGKITRSDENYFLRVMTSDRSLNSEELKQITCVFDRLQMGLLKVID